jgi:tRNA threonylcarbamoyl adenosine modification protein YeaZ
MLLAIDTSAGTSVALVDLEGGVLAQHGSENTRGHAELIGTLIERCLVDAPDGPLAPTSLSGVVVGMGPGPFTGLRVGIAAARAFALGIGKPVVPLASHDAVAHDLARACIVVTDARRNEIACSEYAEPDADGLPQRVRGPELLPRAELDALAASRPGLELVEAATIPAGALGMLAERAFAAGRLFGPGGIAASDQPLYLRQPDATIPTGPKRVTG